MPDTQTVVIKPSIHINNRQFVFNKTPFKHQITAYEKAYDKEFYALFMEMATGKTKTTVDIACNYFLEGKIEAVLLIAPNGVQNQWMDEQVPEHSTVNTEDMLWSTNKSKCYQQALNNFLTKPSRKLKWFYVNVDTFSSKNYLTIFKNYCKMWKTLIVIDEATRIKNPEAQRTYNITYELNEVQMYKKMIKSFIYTSKYRLVLTGTMVTNSPFDLYSYFTFLKHDFWGINFFAFKAMYGVLIKDSNEKAGRVYYRSIRPDEIKSIRKKHEQGLTALQISMMLSTSESNIEFILNNPEIESPYKNLDKLKSIISPYCYIVKKDDCLDLPKKMYEHIYVEMNAEQKRVYKELEQKLVTEYYDKELTVTNKMVLIGRLQQITGGFFPYIDVVVDENGEEKIVKAEPKAIPITESNPKINAILADLEETGDEQIIIWCRFTAEINALYTYLSEKCKDKKIGKYFGGVSKEDRKEVIQDFKNKEMDILICNQQTAGLGLNLQVSHICYYFSNSFSLEHRAQSEDRTHRPGQTHVCVYKDLIVKGTVDEKIYKVLKDKKSLLDYFRDTRIEEVLK